MTEFGAGDNRHSYDDSRRGRSGDWHTPAPRASAHDSAYGNAYDNAYDRAYADAYADAYAAAQRPARRRHDAGVLVGDTGPLPPVAGPHISGPLPELPWWQDGDGGAHHLAEARHRGAGGDFPGEIGPGNPAPLPPRPSGAWSRLQRGRESGATAGSHDHGSGSGDGYSADHDVTDVHAFDTDWDDRTGGLEVIGAHVEEERPRRWRRGRRPAQQPLADHYDDHPDDVHGDLRDDPHADLHDELIDAGHGPLTDDEIPLKPYDSRRARARRRRRRAAAVLALLVLTAVVLGVVFGGSKLLGVINPSSRDYTGQGYGTVDIRVHDGDTLSDIARTLVDAQVIAGTGHFVSAAEQNPAATGISPGVYAMKLHMNGKAALTRLLDPASRLLTRVTVPEGLTVANTLKRLSDQTHVQLADLQAAAKNPAALGLPAYANGSLEGFLFPATYDFEPHTTAPDMLKAMVTRAVQALDKLGIPADQRLTVLTKASIVQAEAGSVDDMGKIATVLNNRLAANMPLQLDTTVNYANGKSGVTTTPQDRANPSPYNTYLHPGLPPGPISNPGDEALKATLSPTPGPWLFFVVVNPDTGETRFATTAQEHQQNVALFQQWLKAHPNG